MNNTGNTYLPRSWYGTKKYPFSFLGQPLTSIIDELLDGTLEPVGYSDKQSFVPRVEVTEDENKLVVKAELPGMKEEDVEISLTKKELTLKGERKQVKEQKEGSFSRSEWSYGRFERVLPLRFEVEDEKVEATFADGVLSIILPKSKKEISETRKVTIKRSQ